MKMLIIVDPTLSFCPGGELAVPEGDAIMPVINRLMAEGNYDRVIMVREIHEPNDISFASNHPGASPFDLITVNGKTIRVWPNHSEKGTPGCEPHPALDRERIDREVIKGRRPEVECYSGVFYSDGVSTGLIEAIDDCAVRAGESREMVETHVCGLATDYCAKDTALDLRKVGFRTAFLVDASRAVNLKPGDEVAALREMASVGIDIIESRDVLPHERRPDRRHEIQLSH